MATQLAIQFATISSESIMAVLAKLFHLMLSASGRARLEIAFRKIRPTDHNANNAETVGRPRDEDNVAERINSRLLILIGRRLSLKGISPVGI